MTHPSVPRLLALALAAAACLPACSRRERVEVSYYYLSSCPACGTTRDNQSLQSLLDRASQESRRFRVTLAVCDLRDDANVERLAGMFEKHEVPPPDRRVPMAFDGARYYAGTVAIEELAHSLLSR